MGAFASFSWIFFGVAVCVTACLQFVVRKGEVNTGSADFKKFQWLWLTVYYTAMFCDWLQGPNVYVLYESYGLAKDDIAVLFVAGFASSAVFGTFVGSIADKYGRKKMSVAFGVFYSLACLTKLVNNFQILLLGRVLSGIATSLLFSVFEAWMVAEHLARGFNPEWLGSTFSKAIFGNGIVAVVAGVFASFLTINFGYVSPFIVSFVFLVLVSLWVSRSWGENFGDETMELSSVFSGGLDAITSDQRVLLLGLIQSLFEASMYVFVFMWTPVLGARVPEFKDQSLGLFGLTFASFMVCIMIGSSLFSLLQHRYSVEVIYCALLGISAAVFFVISISTDGYTTFLLFMLFEVACGVHFTCNGMLRGKYIPEESRSAVMNLFRIPLNLLVVLVLLWIKNFADNTVYQICSAWLFISFFCCYRLISLSSHSPPSSSPATSPKASPSLQPPRDHDGVTIDGQVSE